MIHETLLTDNDAMQARLKKIVEDFAKLPPERQQAIITKLGDKVAAKLEAELKRLGDEFLGILPGILEEIEHKDDDAKGGG